MGELSECSCWEYGLFNIYRFIFACKIDLKEGGNRTSLLHLAVVVVGYISAIRSKIFCILITVVMRVLSSDF